MKDYLVRKLILDNENTIDCGLQSILKIIEHLKSNYNSVNLQNLINKYYPKTNYQSLIAIAYENQINCELIDNPSINSILASNKPFIFKSNGFDNSYHFLVCFSYCEKEGFYIWDYRNGHYHATINGFKDIWDGNEYLTF